MKFSALNVDFNGVVKFRPPRFEESSVRVIKFGYPLQKARFLLLSTNLAREWLQIDTDLLRIITSTADDLSGVPTSMTLNDLEIEKQRVFSEFCAISGYDAHLESKFSPKF